MNKTLFLWLLSLTLLACKAPEKENKKENEEVNLSYKNSTFSIELLIDSLDIKKEDLKIMVDKSDYKLSVLANEELLKEYPVVFGTNPIDDKLIEGDRCTPEGLFGIRDFYPHRLWSKFIWIDYPTEDSWKKHRKAKANGDIPENATIGGEIGIHGVPENSANLISDRKNWTWGCISMDNDDLNDLYKVINKNISVEIKK